MVHNEQFEYKIFKDVDFDDIEKILNELGSQGWELVIYNNDYCEYILKRKK